MKVICMFQKVSELLSRIVLTKIKILLTFTRPHFVTHIYFITKEESNDKYKK